MANKYKTGFCGQGFCEGTKPTTRDGQPMKICEFWQDCSCSCHKQITEMYKMADLPREPPEQSKEWQELAQARHLETAMMLDAMARDALSRRADIIRPPVTEGSAAGQGDPATGTPAPVIERRFAPTPTGIRAKGQLENEVLAVCNDFANDVYDWQNCTPKLVSEEIARKKAIEPPSTGAINAVWDRWEKLGFALQGKKPSRFVAFCVDGSLMTLEDMKLKAKRQRRLVQAESKRGMPRPRPR